jgi:hypothetical protein
MMNFNAALRNQTDAFLTGMLVLHNPGVQRLHPSVLAAMVGLFRECDFAVYPVYDVEGHQVVCGGAVRQLKTVDWAMVPAPVVAKILGYCVEKRETDDDRKDRVWADRFTTMTHYAGIRDSQVLTVGMTLAEDETRLENVPEAILFRCVEGRQWNEIRSYLANNFLRQTRKRFFADPQFFHPTNVRSEDDVRTKLEVRPGAWVDPHVMKVLQRTKLFDRMTMSRLWGNRKMISVKRPVDDQWPDAFDWSFNPRPVYHDKEYESLFLKYGMGQMATKGSAEFNRRQSRVKRKLEAETIEWVFKADEEELSEPPKKKRRFVEPPRYFPQKDMWTGSKSPEVVWTGRIMHKRVWKYETKNLLTNALGSVTAGQLYAKKNASHLNELYIPTFQVEGVPGGEVHHMTPIVERPFVCVEKRVEWTPYGEILEEMFERKAKPLFAEPGCAQDEVVEAMSRTRKNRWFHGTGFTISRVPTNSNIW